ncbi:MAG: zinc-dependent alcohol dehydrogenase [Acidobacteriia bacterium]|nr:zinc-dependent alcohol dehydrogenase [Terriglobia bacterium]
MKAAILHDYKQPLRIEDVPRPECAADEVLIQVEACGVCHSDLHLAEGGWPQLLSAVTVKKPLVMGHEAVGRVVEKGRDVAQFALGDRVGVAWIYWSCGQCRLCKEGLENLCPRQIITGVTVDGGYAEFVKAKASHVTRVPETLSAQEAAPLFCAGLTVYRSSKKAGIRPGQRVAVFGIGGLGHLAVQVAKSFQAEVIGIDVTEEKLALARSLGADHALNAAAGDFAAQLKKVGGPHVALVTSAAKAAYDLAFSSLRPDGTLAVIGLPAEDLTFPPIVMVARETRIVASSVGTRADLRELLDLAAAGKVRCHSEARPLAQINQVFDDMRHGRILGRVVVRA